MKNLGFYSFIITVIVLAVLGAKLPEAGQEWPSTTWPFLATMILSIASLILWRKALHIELANSTKGNNGNATHSASGQLIEKALSEVESLNISTKSSTENVCQNIDRILRDCIYPFLDIKDREFIRLGFSNAAEIYLELAYSERMLNRIWTASSDGCLLEAEQVQQEAIAGLRRTVQKIKDHASS